MNDIVTTVIGRVTHSPQRRALDGGREVVTFRMACNHRYFDRASGTWREASTSYVSVDVWRRRLGRCVLGSLAKGDPVLAHGRLLVREFEQDGRMRSAVTLVAEAVGPDLNSAMAVVTRIRRPAETDEPAAASGGDIGIEGEAPEEGERIEGPALLDDEAQLRVGAGLALIGAGATGEPVESRVAAGPSGEVGS